ncbi:MAG: transketolase [Eubacteriales bacterium]|nr:transketolase [Eubacteriales bacterium]
MDHVKETDLKRLALEIRIGILDAIGARGFGHLGGSLSIADLLAVLYGSEMRYDVKNPAWPERDKLVCSKGHAGPAVYAALAVKGFFPYEVLKTLNQPGTTLPSHCDHDKTPGVDITTGSLGQGTSLAAGMALGDKLKGRDSRTFLVVGDGEANEGQVWETIMFASAKKLDNLFVFLDNNKKQLDGPVAEVLNIGPFGEKFEAFGFDTQVIPGNDVAAIYEAIEKAKAVTGKPHAIVLDTIKGAGIKEV